MIKKLATSTKMGIMLAVPILGLLFLGINGVIEKAGLASEMDHVLDLTGLAIDATGLMHETQMERGMTALFLSTDGTKFGTELVAQRSESDAASTRFKDHLRQTDFSLYDEEFSEKMATLSAELERMPATRREVTSLSISATDAIAYYTGLNNSLIAAVPEISHETSNGRLVNRLAAFVAFVQQKEAAGIQRAVLSSVFAADRFTEVTFRKFNAAVTKQAAYNEAFDFYSTPEQVEFYRQKLAGKFSDEVGRMETVAFAKSSSGGFRIDADYWFRMMTGKINQLKTVEDRLSADLITLAGDIRSNANRALALFLAVSLGIIALSILMAFLLARSINRPLSMAGAAASEVASQIVAAIQQQTATTSETATSVSEATTTIEEIRQTSEMTSEKAKTVVELAERSQAASEKALQSVQQGIAAMRSIQEEVSGIARNILELSERNIQIGEIVQSVNAIAEQSNLLAVNASIEAAKAGEQGKGFSVVASEVKALAGHSKEATEQIRTILAEIQKASNAAVMVTEQGAKRVEEGSRLIEELGQSVHSLSQVIEQSADSAGQISAATNQQLAGIEQITSAMRNIETATRDNATGAEQLAQAAEQVELVSHQLNDVVNGHRASA